MEEALETYLGRVLREYLKEHSVSHFKKVEESQPFYPSYKLKPQQLGLQN